MSIIFLPRRAFQAVGCLYVSYWALFFGIVAFLIITSYLQEHKHHPVGKAASHEASIATRKYPKDPPKVKVGQLVVLVEDVDGVEAGREGCIMGMRDDVVTVGCQSRERLHLILARTWQVLPRELFRRLSAREGGINE